jgi:TP901 family phage tail tape measure protein
MAGESTKVISYIADISDILRKLKEIEAGTQQTASAINKDFTIASQAADKGIASISSTTKTVFDKQTGTFKDLTSETAKFTQNVQVADNEYGKFAQTFKTSADGTKSVTSSFRELSDEQARATGLIDPLIGKSSQLGSNFNKVADINQKFSKELANLGQVSTIVKGGLVSISGDTQKFEAIAATTKGQLFELNETITRTPDGLQQVARTVTDVTDKYKPLNRGTKELDTNTVSLGQNIQRLLSRAALTIPIWLALRGVMMGVSSTIQNGIKDLIEFDRALQKVKQNLSGTPEEIASNFKVLRKEITETSLKLGTSTEEVAESVKKFASLGFAFEESMAGGIGATKLATVLFGDASETADAFARAMNLLIDRSKGATSAQQQMNEMYALAAKLEKTNQFEIKEINDSLKNFAGTAKSFNLTGKQTLAVLATLGTSLLEGARGGTAASTAFQQMVSNIPNVSKILGLDIDIKKIPIIDVFVQIIEAIEKLNKSNPVAATEAINKLFGGMKGAKPIRALIADLGKLKENLAMTSTIDEFESRVDSVTDIVSKQSDIMHNLNKEIGKAFITGLVGGADFLDSLKIINKVLDVLRKNATLTGNTFKNMFLLATTGTIGFAFIKNQDAKKNAARIADELFIEINDAIKGRKKDTELRDLIIHIGKLKLDKVGQQQRNALGKQLQKQLQDKFDESPVEVEARVQAEFELDRQKFAGAILKSELSHAKAIGASNSELLKAEIAYRKILSISDEEENILERKLDLERALSEEKRLQSRVGSDSMKLFKIAQEQGTDIARQIGDVLAGNVDFSNFIRRGGEVAEIFKKEFADIFEQQQAIEFFRGNRVPGLEELNRGTSIPILEEGIRGALNEGALRFKAIQEGALAGAKGFTAAEIQDLQIKRAKIDFVEMPTNIGWNAEQATQLQNLTRTQSIIPAAKGPNTPTEVQKAINTATASYNINFHEGAFTIFGTPDKATQDAIQKSVTKGIQDFQDKLVGKQTNVL